ncbi:MAG: LPS biosynthesis protein [Candidatus Endolissoclinum sp. TMED37]|nr:MAG: LPS biosynthesis protein [Candidatus Endolissoclinum sp. TMED37]|tara:strand:+ start:700 stop:1830 length:1131 start_codon:yes stop_codon:yes gene_type:complete
MKYCKSCLQPNTRPNSEFNNEGICPACKYHELLKNVDWQERYEILNNLIDTFPKNNNQIYDCIIGVSGGKDSTRQALFVRDKLKLNPLLVCLSYPPEQVAQRGVNNISNLINLGFNVVFSTTAPKTWRKLMRESFFRFTNWARSTEMALFASVPQMAIRYKIPLIFWGENPGLQVGDLKTLGKYGFDGNNLRNMNTLDGGRMDWMYECGFQKNELLPFIYPTQEEFEKNNIQIVYLGWFLGDWSEVNNAMYAVSTGLEIRDDTVENTGDLYGVTALDEEWVTLNQMIKFYKFGFGRISDYVNEDIRNGRLTREEGILLIEKYDDSCSDDNITSFCKYIEITKHEFWEQIHKSMNKDLFELDENCKIVKKFKVGHDS